MIIITYSYIKLILLYTYPFKTFAVLVAAVMFIVIALPFYGIYKLIIRTRTEKTKATFDFYIRKA